MTTRVIYLLHFDRALGRARHYMGSAVRLEQRLAEHRKGNGARLMFWVAREVPVVIEQELRARPVATVTTEARPPGVPQYRVPRPACANRPFSFLSDGRRKCAGPAGCSHAWNPGPAGREAVRWR